MDSRDYSDLSRDELIRILEARDRRETTRFGLVWERRDIEADTTLNDDFVALDLDPSASVGKGPWRNLLIEGDNFDALRYLRMTHAGRVKCILIDPPYNTGSNDFIYNDRFVDKEHAWRHSMWLEYLYQRLTLARDLLSEDGVILVHIGEDEVSRLGCLMDQIFPGMKVATFVWRTRSGASISKDHFVSSDHEYILCYANKGFAFGGVEKSFAGYGNPDNDPRGDWANFNLTKGQSYKERPRSYYPIQNPDTGVWYACNPDRVWAFSSETRIKPGQKVQGKFMEQVIAERKVLWPKDDKVIEYSSLETLFTAIDSGTAPRHIRRGLPDLEFWVGKKIGYGMPRYKAHKRELDTGQNPISTWLLPATTKASEITQLETEGIKALSVGFTAEGASQLVAILGTKDFPYPKPLSLIQAFVSQATGSEDIVLDFFAGSGTTGHAVLAQNAVDDGNRRFILVSSTEATAAVPERNVCRDIAQKRLAKAIGGYSFTIKNGVKKVEGLGGDFAYLRARRIPAGELMEIDHAQVWTALQLMHGETLSPFSGEAVATAGDEEQTLIYVTRFRESNLPALRNHIARGRAVLLYSWQPELLRQHLRASHVDFQHIPETLARRFRLKT
jgi:adenine-specific DNA-methyltransferase